MSSTQRTVVAALAMSIGLAPIGACSSPSGGPPTAEVLRRSGVGIIAEGCGLTAHLASGVVAERPGQVITVAHAIAGATSIEVVDANGTAHPATVLAFDKDRDLAVLDVAGLDAPALDLGAVTTGAATTLTWKRDDGVTTEAAEVVKELVVTIEDIYVDEVVERRGIEVAADIEIGNSGGPVVSPAGNVIGIIYANSRSRDRVGFATDSSEIESLLTESRAAGDSDDNGRCT